VPNLDIIQSERKPARSRPATAESTRKLRIVTASPDGISRSPPQKTRWPTIPTTAILKNWGEYEQPPTRGSDGLFYRPLLGAGEEVQPLLKLLSLGLDAIGVRPPMTQGLSSEMLPPITGTRHHDESKDDVAVAPANNLDQAVDERQ